MFKKRIAVIAPGITSNPYWWEDVPRPVLPDIEIPKRSDVVIVGSGYTGLSAALTLAKAGRSVLILEAEDVGFGASTRTGGLMGDLMKPGKQVQWILRLMLAPYLHQLVILIFICYGLTVMVISAVELQVMG